jgi:hypothetical protein
VLVVDDDLDMRGTDVVRMLKTETTAVPFVLISGFLTTDITVEAMKLGALNVLDKGAASLPRRTFSLAIFRRPPQNRSRQRSLSALSKGEGSDQGPRRSVEPELGHAKPPAVVRRAMLADAIQEARFYRLAEAIRIQPSPSFHLSRTAFIDKLQRLNLEGAV